MLALMPETQKNNKSRLIAHLLAPAIWHTIQIPMLYWWTPWQSSPSDTRPAQVKGAVAFFTAKDIPGDNDCNGLPFLADGKVEHYGQPIAFIVATLPSIAEHAASLVDVKYGDAGVPVLTIVQARAAASFLSLPGAPKDSSGATASNGNVEAALRDAPLVIRDAKYVPVFQKSGRGLL